MKKLGINYYEDDAMNEKEFVPSNEKPALVRNAHIDTNIPGNPPYHAEYALMVNRILSSGVERPWDRSIILQSF